MGAFPLPIALAYRPRADLYAGPDGTLWWTVRLWETDRAEVRVLSTERLRRYAEESGLPGAVLAIDRLVGRARRGRSP